jgi:hypothetical protein
VQREKPTGFELVGCLQKFRCHRSEEGAVRTVFLLVHMACIELSELWMVLWVCKASATNFDPSNCATVVSYDLCISTESNFPPTLVNSVALQVPGTFSSEALVAFIRVNCVSFCRVYVSLHKTRRQFVVSERT